MQPSMIVKGTALIHLMCTNYLYHVMRKERSLVRMYAELVTYGSTKALPLDQVPPGGVATSCVAIPQ